VLGKFVDIDLGPESVSYTEMGYLYEELIRRFSELSNETAGEHFTPREVVELMVNLLFVEDDDLLGKPGTVKTMLDPACGTGGMLSVSGGADIIGAPPRCRRAPSCWTCPASIGWGSIPRTAWLPPNRS
jgi:hypothetical protein